jgi:hypothetical protein
MSLDRLVEHFGKRAKQAIPMHCVTAFAVYGTRELRCAAGGNDVWCELPPGRCNPGHRPTSGCSPTAKRRLARTLHALVRYSTLPANIFTTGGTTGFRACSRRAARFRRWRQLDIAEKRHIRQTADNRCGPPDKIMSLSSSANSGSAWTSCRHATTRSRRR